MHKSQAARSIVSVLAICGCLSVAAPIAQAQSVQPLPQAHAHNDYLHEHPLGDALHHGFCSVEADIYLVDGQLLVAHDRKDVKPENTLQKQYLDPLKARIAKNAGRVYPAGPPFTLLIDIKSEAEPTYRVLHDVLAEYAEMLTTVEGDRAEQRAVNVIVSGNRPQSYIAAQPRRYCGIDGRISDLDSDKPAALLPMISDNWSLHFTWRGVGEVPAKERERLRDVVRRAHTKGRRVRFWATPENLAVWQLLVDEQVDLINTDDLPGLQAFLTSSR